MVRLIFMAHNDALAANHFNVLIVYSSASEVLKKRMTFPRLVLHFFELGSLVCRNVEMSLLTFSFAIKVSLSYTCNFFSKENNEEVGTFIPELSFIC